MQTVKDQSFGVIPVFKKPDDSLLFCVIEHGRGEHYGFPKGHPNPGETEIETGKRELQEETGLGEVEIISEAVFDQKYQFEHEGIIYDKTVRYFLGFVSSVDTQIPDGFKHEISEMKWLPYKEAREVLTFDNAKVILDQVWKYLNK